MKLLIRDVMFFEAKITALTTCPHITPEQVQQSTQQVQNAINVWICCEQGDNATIIQKVANDIAKIAIQLQRKTILLLPFGHLSNKLADSQQATFLIQTIEKRLATKFDIHRGHFGSDKQLFFVTTKTQPKLRIYEPKKTKNSSYKYFVPNTYQNLVEKMPFEWFQEYMQVEKILVQSIQMQNVVYLGAGYGRFLPYIEAKARYIGAIENNTSMYQELAKRATKGKTIPIFGNIINELQKPYLTQLQQPLVLLLQNTLGTIDGNRDILLTILGTYLKKTKGKLYISLFRQQALGSVGLQLYSHLEPMIGPTDTTKTNLKKGLFVSKTGYISKRRSDSDITKLQTKMQCKVVQEWKHESRYIGLWESVG